MKYELNAGQEIAINSECSLTTEKLMNSDEAAAYLGISIASLMNKVSQGRIPYYKFGRLNRYMKSELSQLLLSNKRGTHGN